MAKRKKKAERRLKAEHLSPNLGIKELRHKVVAWEETPPTKKQDAAALSAGILDDAEATVAKVAEKILGQEWDSLLSDVAYGILDDFSGLRDSTTPANVDELNEQEKAQLLDAHYLRNTCAKVREAIAGDDAETAAVEGIVMGGYWSSLSVRPYERYVGEKKVFGPKRARDAKTEQIGKTHDRMVLMYWLVRDALGGEKKHTAALEELANELSPYCGSVRGNTAILKDKYGIIATTAFAEWAQTEHAKRLGFKPDAKSANL
ncbi:MAG TPA: hypothetical protein QF564_29920, partial [Pirellulaceae bacterium]|nr:hypothetical protein [Pirellulaceae bacterium]